MRPQKTYAPQVVVDLLLSYLKQNLFAQILFHIKNKMIQDEKNFRRSGVGGGRPTVLNPTFPHNVPQTPTDFLNRPTTLRVAHVPGNQPFTTLTATLADIRPSYRNSLIICPLYFLCFQHIDLQQVGNGKKISLKWGCIFLLYNVGGSGGVLKK